MVRCTKYGELRNKEVCKGELRVPSEVRSRLQNAKEVEETGRETNWLYTSGNIGQEQNWLMNY